MARDIRKMFEEDNKSIKQSMPKGHEARFTKRLEREMPETSIRKRYSFFNIAASIVILLGLTFGAYKVFNSSTTNIPVDETVVSLKSLGDISPDLKKVENYYLANINLELANVTLTDENKEVFDSYLERLEELNKEYKRLSVELTETGPNELTVNALINNLKLRLNLMHRLKEQLNELKNPDNGQKIT